MRTIVYVDGYNLYYSALTKSPYKWLDLHTFLLNRVIRPVHPQSEIYRIKFFTAPVLGSFASHPQSPDRQRRYHNALRAAYPDIIEIIEGYHSPGVTHALPLDAPDQSPIAVRKMEEKQTDVNIALHMYRDAIRGEVDHVVLVSNDSDLEPALKLIRGDCPAVTIRGGVPDTRA